MVDVRLLYPMEKMDAAARLADSVEAAGYQVERKALADARGFPDLAAESRDARVLLLIWSRGLVSAAMAGGALGEARRSPNLVEVSVDGIEPAVGAEVSPVILLSGWRGQPFHQGWQRILADIKRLCGPGNGGRNAPHARGEARRSKANRRPVRVALAASALVAATLGAGAVLDRGAPDASPPAVTPAPVVATSSSLATASAGRREAPAATAAAIADASSGGVSMAAAAPAPASTRGSEFSADPPARRPTAKPKRSAPKRLVSAAVPEVKRYSRKHSKTMRLFCQRSGRSTPQCRSFARSIRALRG